MDRSIGPYRLADTLGMLPFGELVAASHPARSEALAVLLLAEPLGSDHRLRGLLRLEIARASGLRHPALARTIEVGEHAGAPYLVIERPAGGITLSQVLSAGAPTSAAAPSPARERPDQQHALDIVRQLAAGLDAAHARRLPHGALSADMVLIGADGQVRLLGIGVLAAIDETGLVATVAEQLDARFIAPEQQSGRRAVASADGYALGVLAGLLLGQEGGTASVSEPAPVATGTGGSGTRVAAVLARQTAPVAAQRYPSCVAFAAALAAAASPAAASPAAIPPSLVSPSSIGAGLPVSPLPSTAGSPPEATVPPFATPSANSRPMPAAPSDSPSPPPVPPVAWTLAASPAPAPASPAFDGASPPSPTVEPLPAAAASLRPDTLVRPVPPSIPAPTAVTDAVAESPSVLGAPAARAPKGFGGWVRAVIDPPTAVPPRAVPTVVSSNAGIERTGPAAADTPGAGSVSPVGPVSPVSDAVTVTNSAPTPAMLVCLARTEQRDLLTEGLRWIASAFPSVERGLSYISRDGKTGPLPTGIALVVALALLLLLVGQIWPATVLIAALLALQWLPRLIAKLTSSEWAGPDAVAVTGPARVRRRRIDPFGELCELVLGNGMVLNLRRSAYEQLVKTGSVRAGDVATPSPTPGAAPILPRLVEHQLPVVTSTYLSTNRLLFDVRAADGAILLRHPEYEGELGDRLETPGHAAPAAMDASWQPVGRGRSQALPLPAVLKASLQQAQTAAQGRVIVQFGVPALVVLLGLASSYAPFIIGVAIVLVFLFGGPPVTRASLLRRVRNAPSIVRVNGPVRLTETRSGKSRSYFLHLEDAVTIPIDVATRNLLARLGTRGTGGGWAAHVTTSLSIGQAQLVTEHDVPALTVAYVPTGPLLLEIHNPFGTMIYRDPAVPPGSISDPPTTS